MNREASDLQSQKKAPFQGITLMPQNVTHFDFSCKKLATAFQDCKEDQPHKKEIFKVGDWA